MEAEDVFVLDGVGDGVGVQLALENILRRPVGGLLAINLLIIRVLLKNRRAGKTK